MKKLLIISYLFAPTQAIGAIRWTKLAKYLTRMGVAVDVITTASNAPEDELLRRSAKDVRNIFRIKHGDPRFFDTTYVSRKTTSSANAEHKPGLVMRLKEWAKKNPAVMKVASQYYARLDYARGCDFAEQAEEYIENNINMADYDAVVASFGPVGNTLVALWIKERYPETRLIMDFRDPMARSSTAWAVRGVCYRLQKNICEAADELVAVTDGFAKVIFGERYGANDAHVIENGYDPEDFPSISTEPTELYAKSFSFVYTGQLYAGKQSLSPLFAALAQLAAKGILNTTEMKFNYAGPSITFLRDMAEKYGMADIIIDHGVLPRGEALKLQQSNRFLALSSWNNRGDEGVLTGKLYEYMVAGRPIIATVTGNLANSELRRVIERGRLGVVHEQADPGADDRLYEYLKREAIQYKQGQDADYSPDENYVAGFSYEELAKKIHALI